MRYSNLFLLGLFVANHEAFANDLYKLDIAAQVEGRIVSTMSIQLGDGSMGSVLIPYGDPNTLMEIKLSKSVKDGNPGLQQKVMLYNQDSQGHKSPLCRADVLSTVGKYAEILCNKRPNKPPLLIVIVNHKI